MRKSTLNSKQGFTIIEVVLVLAIAGLIFLMVFVALPNLQRTQRDTQRRDDISRLSTSLTQYITNNNKLPSGTVTALTIDENGTTPSGNRTATDWQKFGWNYLLAGGNDIFEDPNGQPYTITVKEYAEGVANTSTEFDYNIQIVTGAKCGEEGGFSASAGSRKFAVSMRLESSGYYCMDNG